MKDQGKDPEPQDLNAARRKTFMVVLSNVKKKEKEERFMEDGGEEKMIGGWRNRSAVSVGQKLVAS
jgi:hypothetical protein